MTYDLVVLCHRMPNVSDVVAGMAAAGRELRVRRLADGAVVQLCDDDGHPLVSIEAPQLVSVAGEVERVLGAGTAGPVDVPVWWLELRAAARDRGPELAHAFADEVAARLDGRVWSGAEAAEVSAAEVAATDPAPGDGGGRD